MLEVTDEVPVSSELIRWFGYWPSFHDAEVLEIELRRTGHSKSPDPATTLGMARCYRRFSAIQMALSRDSDSTLCGIRLNPGQANL